MQYKEAIVTGNASSKHLMILVAAGYFMIALLHLVAPFLGPWTYSYFGANYLARLAQQGSSIPAIAGFVIGIAFTVFGLMALSAAGKMKSRKIDRPILWGVGIILLLRGLLVIPQTLLLIRGASTFARGPLFSIVALLLGFIQLLSLWSNR